MSGFGCCDESLKETGNSCENGEEKGEESWAYLDYLPVLLPNSYEQDEEFLQYYSFPSGAEKRVMQVSLTRAQFALLVSRAVALMHELGIGFGDKVLMHVSANRVEDLVLRAAAVVLGFVPVTVNWQADGAEQVHYKLQAAGARVVVYDYQSQGLGDLRNAFPSVLFVHVNDISAHSSLGDGEGDKDLAAFISQRERQNLLPRQSDIRCIIFTSGTTGTPKGVALSYSNYSTNRLTFESFLGLSLPAKRFVAVAVNPLHHTNSTSVTDWALRRQHSLLVLIERYTSQYWACVCASVLSRSLAEVAALSTTLSPEDALPLPQEDRTVVLPLVSRHIDFLDSLSQSPGAMPIVSPSLVSRCLSRAVLLLGSAPVGPSTVQRIQRLCDGALPTVRFGSTETTLQVCGIPIGMERESVLTAFKRGWSHRGTHSEENSTSPSEGEGEDVSGGYYIGQDHFPFTEVKVVRSVDRENSLYMHECAEGEAGYLVTRGGHIMRGYVNATDAQRAKALDERTGWYLALGDIGFFLVSQWNARRDFYWQTRDSQMLIRGGANYAFEQVNAELSRFVQRAYGLDAQTDFRLAVCGVKIASEHEDDCCVCIELVTDKARERERDLSETFLSQAKAFVSKGAKPDHLRLCVIPMVASKGVVNVPEMTKAWKQHFLALK